MNNANNIAIYISEQFFTVWTFHEQLLESKEKLGAYKENQNAHEMHDWAKKKTSVGKGKN